MRKFICLALLLVVLSACSGGGSSSAADLPDAQTLLEQSAEVMAGVTSVAFELTIDGDIAGLGVRSAQGNITADRKVKATALVSVGGRTVEYQYISVDDRSFLKGPTGGFQDVPEQLATSFFNPGGLLSGDKSLSKGLTLSTDAITEAEEEVNGEPAYRIKATVNPAAVEGLTLLASSSSDQQATLWISKADKYLVKASMTSDIDTAEDKPVLTVTFSDFNENVEITAPA
ncbi:MAG: LppX_LprAFG lipoprotein [Actinomycetota bacterium]